MASKENPKFEGVKPLNSLIVTTSFLPDWDLYFSVMKRNGTIVPLSVSFDEMKLPYASLLLNQLAVKASLVAPRLVHRQMLEFSARNNIVPMVEELEMNEEGLNTAFDRLDKGDVRYRFVLRNPRYKGPAVK